MTAVAAFAALALPLIALPALVGALTKWWLKTKLRPKSEVGVAAGALYVILLAILGGMVSASSLAEGEGYMAIPFLMVFLGVLGVPIAVAVALRVRSTIARSTGKVGA